MRRGLAAFVALSVLAICSGSDAAKAQNPTSADCARACAAQNEQMGEFRIEGNRARCICDCKPGWIRPAGGGACVRATPQAALSPENCARVGHLIDLYSAKLEELRRWRGDLARYRNEFETARAQAWKGSLSDVLGAIPGEQTGAYLVKHFPNKVPASFAPRFASALKAAKGLNAFDDARLAETDSERIKKVGEGHAAVRELLLQLAGAEDKQTRKLLETSGNVFKATLAGLAFGAQDKPRADWNSMGELAADLVGSFFEPMSLSQSGIHLFIRGADYGLAWWSAQQLASVASENWNAERALQDHIARWRDYQRACP